MLVGEQPGNEEDRAGAPFVGPAGRELDRGLARAGIDRSTVYVTNAVKHFKWEPRGKKRIHQKPTAREIAACRLWLDAEIEAVQPTAIVCLGATAAQTLLGRSFRVTQARGKRIASPLAPVVMATVHPRRSCARARTRIASASGRRSPPTSRASRATSSAPEPVLCRNAPAPRAEIRAPLACRPQRGTRLAGDGSGRRA